MPDQKFIDHNKDNGLTLIELLVVIGMIVIILGIVVLNTVVLGNKVRIEAAANQILDIIKETRHNSVSAKEFKNNLFPSYGIYFDKAWPGSIIIYADCLIDDNNDETIGENDNFTYNPSSTDCSGENGLVKTITLDSRVRIDEIRLIPSIGLGGGSINKVYLQYIRPEPTLWITDDRGDLLSAGKLEIDLIDRSGKFKKTIIFWSTGQSAIKKIIL